MSWAHLVRVARAPLWLLAVISRNMSLLGLPDVLGAFSACGPGTPVVAGSDTISGTGTFDELVGELLDGLGPKVVQMDNMGVVAGWRPLAQLQPRQQAARRTAIMHAGLSLACAMLPGRLALAHIEIVAKGIMGQLLHICSFTSDDASESIGLENLVTYRFVKEAKIHLANVLLKWQSHVLQSIVHELRFPRFKKDVSLDWIALARAPRSSLVIAMDLWDETGQHLSVSSCGTRLDALPIEKEYLLAKLRGESTQGITISTMVHKATIDIIDLESERSVFSEKRTAPLLRMSSTKAEALSTT